MVADPLTSAALIDAWVDFDTPEQLAQALAHLAPIDVARGVLRYRPDTLTAAARDLHRAWADRVETYLPFCLPGDPVGALATPEDCHACPLYTSRRCRGLGWDRRPWDALPDPAAPPLADWAGGWSRSLPRAYWRPTDDDIAAIGALGRTVWDLGGANGYLAWRLHHEQGVDATVVDTWAGFATPDGVRRVVGDARAAKGTPPDVVLVSYPPEGDAFADAIVQLAPEWVVRVMPHPGRLGRPRDYARVTATAAGLSWWRYDPDDETLLADWPVVETRAVEDARMEIRRRAPSAAR